jgi:hypothetical protein
MDPTPIIVVLAIVVLVALVARLVVSRRRAQKLRSQFGGEYDRTVQETGSRREAEQELEERRERVAAFDIRPLSPDDQTRYAAAWRSVQHQFVDDPADAIREADRLIVEVLERRGYPVGDFDARVADLSVEHGDVIGHYRAAHEIAGRDDGRLPTDTEALRQAMVHYRALFASLLGPSQADPDAATAQSAPRRNAS